MSDHDTAASILFGDTMNTDQPQPDNPKPTDPASKLYPTMSEPEDLGVFAPEKPVEAAQEPPGGAEAVEDWSDAQQAQIAEWGITEADSAKIDAIAEKWGDNVALDQIEYDLQGFMQKYGVTREQLEAFLSDELGDEGEPEPREEAGDHITDEVADQWAEQTQAAFSEEEIGLAAQLLHEVGGDELVNHLSDTGWGNHPFLIGIMAAVASKLKERQ